MSALTNLEVAYLREVDASKHLPQFYVYKGGGSTRPHLFADCRSNSSGKLVEYIYLNIDPFCSRCRSSKEWQTIQRFEEEVQALAQVLTTLEDADSLVVELEEDPPVPLEHVGYLLLKLQKGAAHQLNIVAAGKAVAPLVPSLEEHRSVAEKTFVAYLKTDRAHLTALETLRSAPSWPENNNALLFKIEGLQGFDFALAQCYGREITTAVWLAEGPDRMLSLLKDNAPSSPLLLPKGTSLEVLYTLAALWDPESKGALGDASKALTAAIELTPSK